MEVTFPGGHMMPFPHFLEEVTLTAPGSPSCQQFSPWLRGRRAGMVFSKGERLTESHTLVSIHPVGTSLWEQSLGNFYAVLVKRKVQDFIPSHSNNICSW